MEWKYWNSFMIFYVSFYMEENGNILENVRYFISDVTSYFLHIWMNDIFCFLCFYKIEKWNYDVKILIRWLNIRNMHSGE